jgi:hypothetical protein
VRTLSSLAIAGIVSLSPALLSSGVTTAGATTTRYPTCLASQIIVSVGATVSNVSYDYSTSKGIVPAFSKEGMPVYFYNKSTDCHLLMGGPSINAVKHATNVRAITGSELAMSAQIPYDKRVVVEHDQKVEALFLFGNISSPVLQNGRRCDPATATGILVQGYAKPTPSTGRFFARKIPQVCFDNGVGANWSNTGVAWARSK